jgi:hypothetical protein
MSSPTLTLGRWFAAMPVTRPDAKVDTARPKPPRYVGPVFIDDVHCTWRGDPILLHLWRQTQDRNAGNDD